MYRIYLNAGCKTPLLIMHCCCLEVSHISLHILGVIQVQPTSGPCSAVTGDPYRQHSAQRAGV